MQHALSLFRTQRIVKIFLEVDTQSNKLIANIWAENGIASLASLFTSFYARKINGLLREVI